MRTYSFKRWIGVAALMGLTAMTACGDDVEQPGSPDVIHGTDVTDGEGDGTTTTPTQVERRLEFVEDFRDENGQSCRNKERCPVVVGFSDQPTLRLAYTEDNVPVEGKSVSFEVIDDIEGIGWRQFPSQATNSSGVVSVKAGADREKQMVGEFTIKISAGENVPDRFVDFTVTPKGNVPLTVRGSYSGERDVRDYQVEIFRQTSAPGDPALPSCSQNPEYFIGSATSNGLEATAGSPELDITRGGVARFLELPNLERDGTQYYTIVAYAYNDEDTLLAWGCDDVNGEVSFVRASTVNIELYDRAPTYAGVYEVTSIFDFTTAIPEPYKTYVDYVLDFFQSPVGAVLDIVCGLIDGNAESNEERSGFCSNLVKEDGSLTHLGDLLTGVLDELLLGLTQGTRFEQIMSAGKEVVDILREFHIHSQYTINAEPDFGAQPELAGNPEGIGQLAAEDTRTVWQRISLTWSLNLECDPATSSHCGERDFSLTELLGRGRTDLVEGNFKAEVEKFDMLTIFPHPMNLQYGALISGILEKFLFPLLMSDERVDSYEALFGYLLGGGDCLDPNSIEEGCCAVFASRNESSIVPASALRNACESLLESVPHFIRESAGNLTASSGSGFTIGTKEPCQLTIDENKLLVTRIGMPTRDGLCQWQANVGTGGISIKADFYGHRID